MGKKGNEKQRQFTFLKGTAFTELSTKSELNSNGYKVIVYWNIEKIFHININ